MSDADAVVSLTYPDDATLLQETTWRVRWWVRHYYGRHPPGSPRADLAESVVSDVLIRLDWGRRARARIVGQTLDNLYAYLWRCAETRVIDHTRTHAGRRTLWDECVDLDGLASPGPHLKHWETWLIPADEPPPTALDALIHNRRQEDANRVLTRVLDATEAWREGNPLCRSPLSPDRARVIAAWMDAAREEGDPCIGRLALSLGLPRGTVSSHLYRFRRDVQRVAALEGWR